VNKIQKNYFKEWGIKNNIYGFDGFDKAIDALDVKSYELKVPRVVGQINSQGFYKSFNDMLKTASFILSKVEQKYNPDSYKMITPKELLIKLQTNVVLPLAVIIDWQLDNKSKLHYVEQTGAFTTNNVNSIIMPTIQDAKDKDIDMAWEIRAVVDYRYNKRTKKCQYKIKWKRIDKKYYPDQWINESLVSASSLVKKVDAKKMHVNTTTPGLMPK
jgi:hypothetical protein